jgi:hypothetical protein
LLRSSSRPSHTGSWLRASSKPPNPSIEWTANDVLPLAAAPVKCVCQAWYRTNEVQVLLGTYKSDRQPVRLYLEPFPYVQFLAVCSEGTCQGDGMERADMSPVVEAMPPARIPLPA